MSFSWKYPIFVIRHNGGFASAPLSGDGDEPVVALMLFTEEPAAEAFMKAVELDGEVRSLGNDREVAYLIAALRHPCTSVMFNPTLEGDAVIGQWTVDIATLAEKHLPLARSPWDYPVYVLAEGEGYSSITADVPGRGQVVALALFTDAARADSYSESAGIETRRRSLNTPDQLRKLLVELPQNVTVVAIDPLVTDGRRQAKTCVEISVLLEKYLPNDG